MGMIKKNGKKYGQKKKRFNAFGVVRKYFRKRDGKILYMFKSARICLVIEKKIRKKYEKKTCS